MAEADQTLNKVESQVPEQLRKLREPMKDVLDQVRAYAKANPEGAMLWSLGVGFVLGWKLKFW